MAWKRLQRVFGKPEAMSAAAREAAERAGELEKRAQEVELLKAKFFGDAKEFDEREKLPPAPSRRSAIDANTFAFNLIRQQCKAERRNVVVAPFGIEALLAVVSEGATGETKAEIGRALRLADTDVSEVRAIAKHYVERAAGLDEKSRNAKLEFANSVWINERYEVRPQFLEVARAEHRAESFVVDMSSEETTRLMDFWAAEKTHGLIKTVPGAVDAETVLALVNAIYFRGLWSQPFKKEHTRPAEFHLRDGRTVMRARMRRKLTCRYYEREGFKAIGLSYIGGRFVMRVFLPDDMDRFRSELTAEVWAGANGKSVECRVELPKVKLRFADTELVEALRAIGIRRLFERNAELAGIAEQVFASKVAQEAVVNVDEEGTEAAAVSMMVMTLTASMHAPKPRVCEFIVDKPYFFTIEDRWSERVLFGGFVEDPEE